MTATGPRPETAERRRKVIVPRLLFTIAVPTAGFIAFAYGLVGHALAWVAAFVCAVIFFAGFRPVYDFVAPKPPPGSPDDPGRPLTDEEIEKWKRTPGPTIGW